MRAVNQLMTKLGREYWNIVKRIFKYIKRTSNASLYFEGSKFIVTCYVDSNFTCNSNERKSTKAICSHLWEELWARFQNFKLLWFYLGQKYNTWQLHRLAKKLSESKSYWKSLGTNKRRFSILWQWKCLAHYKESNISFQN